MDHTHQLPAHLGQWPCRDLGSAASDEHGQMLTLVEYTTDQGTHRIYVNWNDLTRIMPADPGTPYVVDGRGVVWYAYEDTDGIRRFRLPGNPVEVNGARLDELPGPDKFRGRGIDFVDRWLDKAPALPYIGRSEAGGPHSRHDARRCRRR